MNNQSPLIPQGSLLEQRNKGRARVKIAVFLVLAIHGVGLMALLMQGCKREADAGAGTAGVAADATNAAAPPFVEPTNTAPASNIVETPTNPIVTPPPVEPPPVVPATAPATDYVIAKGDTFSTIHQKFHVSIKALQEANPTVEPTKLKIGQPIHIPAPTTSASNGSSTSTVPVTDSSAGQTYTVKSGDSLTKISGQFGVSIKALRSANSLKTDKIVVGQKLKIPAKSSGSNLTATNSATPTSTPTGQ